MSTFEGTGIPILYMYLKHQDQKVQTPGNLYGSLLRQLITNDYSKLPSQELVDLYQKKVGKSALTAKEKKEALCREISIRDRYVAYHLTSAPSNCSRHKQGHNRRRCPRRGISSCPKIVLRAASGDRLHKGQPDGNDSRRPSRARKGRPMRLLRESRQGVLCLLYVS